LDIRIVHWVALVESIALVTTFPWPPEEIAQGMMLGFRIPFHFFAFSRSTMPRNQTVVLSESPIFLKAASHLQRAAPVAF
ncbi:MAG: hypothetical protein WC824_13105, partial [Bacteroidota bacterium]